MEEKAVALDYIVLDERCQPRAILNGEAVQEYAEVYRDEALTLPPLDVVDVEGDLVLIDGFHRLAGARQAERSFVRVRVVEKGDIDRAAWLAAAANQKHGVRRTNADKRQSTILALQSGVGQEQTVRVIAEHIGVSKSFVAMVRQELEQGLSTVDSAPKTEPEPEPPGEDDDRPEPDMYHTAARRIAGCYRKVCAILGEDDDVCEQLFRALEMAQEREL